MHKEAQVKKEAKLRCVGVNKGSQEDVVEARRLVSKYWVKKDKTTHRFA